jgi:hypothetical protein
MTSKYQAFVEFAKTVMNLSDLHGFTYPPSLKQNGPDSDIIALDFFTLGAAMDWADLLSNGSAAALPVVHPVLPVVSIVFQFKYHGWDLQISGRERVTEKV